MIGAARARVGRDGAASVQPIDAAGLSIGENSGIEAKTQAPARLSAGMYKICTPVSTGIVDNVDRAGARTVPNAGRGAGFRCIAARPKQAVPSSAGRAG
ncbi:MAG: hypothetical protein ABI585_02390 [Betaproteobacteria bacterium]